MATNRWVGSRGAVAQVVTLTIGGAPAAADTVTVTINGKGVTYTVTAADAAAGSPALSVAGNFATLLAASIGPEFVEEAWSNDGTNPTVLATARTPGTPFTLSVSKTGAVTIAQSTTTANASPNDVNDGANWSLGTVPAATNDVLIDGGPDLLWGFGSLAAAAWNSLDVKASFTGNIGLPFFNPNGYPEYRTRALSVATTVPVTIGDGDGQGPTRVVISSGAALAATVLRTQARQDDAIPVVNIYGCSSGTLTVAGGDVALAGDDDTTSATVTSATVGGTGTLTVGKGATVTTLNQKGGTVINRGATPTVNINGGNYALYGTAATAVTADPEIGNTVTFDWRAGGTIGTVTFRGQDGARGPVLECSNDPRQKTITNGTFTGGASLNDPQQTVVMSNAQTWDRASLAASDLGPRFSLTRT